MTELEAVKLFKCLADRSRINIIRSLAQEDMYVERLAERLGLTPATVSFHLRKLEEIGGVKSRKEQYYTMYALCPEVFSRRILDLALEGTGGGEEEARDAAYRQGVIASFFVYGKLTKIPTQRKKKNIVLEELAKAFDMGRTYTEKEVNLILAEFHDDFCTLRRDMVGAGLMSREKGIYRKLGERAE